MVMTGRSYDTTDGNQADCLRAAAGDVVSDVDFPVINPAAGTHATITA
jgi:hypothetical protein